MQDRRRPCAFMKRLCVCCKCQQLVSFQHIPSRPSAQAPSPVVSTTTVEQPHTPCIPPLQKDASQLGLLVLSAMPASHSVDEAKRYSANNCYELSDETAMPLKLVSVLMIGCTCGRVWCLGCGNVLQQLETAAACCYMVPHSTSLSLQLPLHLAV